MGKYDKQYTNKRKQLNKLKNELIKLGLDPFKMPEIPKRKTAGSIRRIESLLTKYRTKQYRLPSGEPITLKQARKEYRLTHPKIPGVGKVSGKSGTYIPQMGDIMLNNLTSLIDRYPSGMSKALRGMLKAQIEKYGYGAVTGTLQDAPPDLINEIQNYLENYSDGDSWSWSDGFGRSVKALEALILSENLNPLESVLNSPS